MRYVGRVMTYEIRLVWSIAGGLVYSPPDPPSLWTEAERKATAIPYAILIAVLTWGRDLTLRGGALESTDPKGWGGAAYLPEGEGPWGCKIWVLFAEALTDDLPGLLASALSEALTPLQTTGLLGQVEVQATRETDGVAIIVGFERPESGGGRYSDLWDAYLETQHG